MRAVLKKGIEGTIQLMDYYSRNGSLRETGRHFGLHWNTVKKRLDKMKDIDEKMIDEYKAEAKKNKSNIFEVLGGQVTRKQLIDFWCKSGYDQSMTVNQVKELAEKKWC